ncbi:hypothetical protein UlMin_001763 [Ulmus minor]
MDGKGLSTTTGRPTSTALHTAYPSRRTTANRIFAAIYASALLALFYHHTNNLLFHSTTFSSFFTSSSLLIADFVFAFMWLATQSFRMRPLYREEFPENLKRVLKKESDFPAIDVFICTADPYKEPPMGVVNTALSVMAYDYPAEKISVYVSDDGGSALTLFAIFEAAKFAGHWLPFCRKNDVVQRCPEAYFAANPSTTSETDKLKSLYESMKVRVENVVERGKVDDQYITDEQYHQGFAKWTDGFTRQDHPTVIQVVLDKSKDEDITGHQMPNLVYVSRKKSRTSAHNFKAGALNVLLRVSATMSNAPVILTLDCDTYSNDPQTPLRVLCYFSDHELQSKLGYVQFPQRFHGINKNDIYGCELKRLFRINPVGMDGMVGPNYVGTGCFFSRRAFFGGPSALVSPEIPELRPDNVVRKPIQSPEVLELAHLVAGCDYEKQAQWGYKIGVRYGSLVEDFFTGYRLQCEGWKSIFCNPEKAAFYGDAPISLVDVLNQNKRWSIGLYEVTFSKYCPLTFGSRYMGILMGLAYAHYSFWPIWSIPMAIYAFLPSLALLNGVSIFPKVSEPWFLLYLFLFLGGYGQDLLDFIIGEGTLKKWWNDQRIWMIRGLSCFWFGSIEYFLKSLGISTHGFNLTSKVVDQEQSKRYEQGVFDFGVESPMFVPMTMAAITNLVAFCLGLVVVLTGRESAFEGLFMQVLISGFGVFNSLPVYEAMITSSKSGIPTRTTLLSVVLSSVLFVAAFFALRK